MARFGEPVSRALALDLAAGGGALRNSRETAEIFLPGGRPLRQQDMLVQLDLAVTLGRLRGDGIGALYAGPMARQLVEAAARAGVAIDPARLRGALPKWSPRSEEHTSELQSPMRNSSAVFCLKKKKKKKTM